ncbi:expressed unknown protein [Seminavis robusta]|nr:expressed unknown protein [Seminavis robusta]|eukprot:Sro3223_g345540.1 n/a (117) ;mRNA; r:7835-8185
MDIEKLPSCINPNGTGKTARGMPKRMEGGKVPSHIKQGGVNYVPIDSGISEGNAGTIQKLTRVPSSPSSSTTASSVGSLSEDDDIITPMGKEIGIEVSKLDDETDSPLTVTVTANC